MKHKMKHVKGSLSPTNTYAITDKTRSYINKAITANDLTPIIKKSPWEAGVININSVSVASVVPASDVYALVDSLKCLINAEGVFELGLEGTLMLTVETEEIEPFMFLIHVEDGQVFSQRAVFRWTERMSYPE